MKNKPYKRFLAFLLCAAMLITYMPSTAFTFADEGSDDQQTVEEAKPAAPAAEKKVEKKEEKKEEAKAEKAPAPATEEKAEAPAPEPKAEEPAETPKEEPAEKPEASGDETRAGPEDTEPVKETVEEPAEEISGEAVDEPAEEAVEETAEEALEETGEEAVDEEALEEEEEDEEDVDKEEEEETFPPFSYDKQFGSVHVYIDAPEGALPEGVKAEIVPVGAGSVEGAVEDMMGANTRVVTAFDITFFDKKGEKFDPKENVSVRFVSEKIDAAENPSVLHIKENGAAEKADYGKVSDNTASFKSADFSVYVVVATVVPRLTVEFKSYDGSPIASMIIKDADTEAEVKDIIYDPGAGTLSDGAVFKGWSTTASYTTDTELLTIAQIRSAAMTKADSITEDETVTYYAAAFKNYTITYQSDDVSPITVGTATAEYPAYENDGYEASYKVSMGYTVDAKHNFMGWIPTDDTKDKSVGYPGDAASEVITTEEGPKTINYYPNDSNITIKGDITFTVLAPEGAWLVFDETCDNAVKGATYTAPQFVLKGEVTKTPSTIDIMACNGYEFGGWYDTAAHAKAHAEDTSVTTGAFQFGNILEEGTTIYASWIPHTSAAYTVIFWTQNQGRDGYEVMASYVNENGEVGQNIPYTSVNNGDEDYATLEGTSAEQYHYTGFCLTEDSKDQEVEITPEGDAVLNLYYDRIEYNFKFYLYRDGTQNNRYDIANNSGTGSDLGGLVTWHTNSAQHPSADDYTIQSETVGGRTYYYFVMQAYYGENISSKWPTYDKITGTNEYQPVSYVMMVGTKLKPNATASGSGTVKGIVSVLDENILGNTKDKNGNYVVIRFPGNTFNNWRYHIWLEAIDGEVPAGKETRTYNGKTYYEDDVMEVRSSNTEVSSQNEPQYTGFDFVTKRGQNWNAQNVTYWTTGNNPTLYHLSYLYNRQQFKISYFDGNYVDGNGNTIQNRAEHPLHESGLIGQGATIPDEYKNYEPDLPEGEKGYVFEGWYIDEGCTQAYTFDKMPIDGINVYAKWRQVQYRVFLHTGLKAIDDTNLYWGSTSTALSFRVGYNDTVSTPTGTRDGYKFLGWYTADGTAWTDSTKLNETTVKDDYDKSTPTDPETKDDKGTPWYGPWDVTTSGAYNSDSSRSWVTKKLDLYAEWSKVLPDADGINVVYNAVGTDIAGTTPVSGSGAPTDDSTYIDNSSVTASSAATAPDGYVFDHWVVCTYAGGSYTPKSGAENELLPGETFTISADDAKVEGTGDATKYTVQLMAVYKEKEKETPTHIYWYKNDGTNEKYREDDPVQINKGVKIYGLNVEAGESIPSRAGFTFKGWAKSADATTPWIAWDSTNGYTYNGTSATEVAADQKPQIEDLYALWDEAEVTINYAVASDSTSYEGVSVSPTSETVKASTGTATGSTASCSTGKYVIDYWTCDDGTEHVGDAATFVPSKNNDGVYEAHTYYAHFKQNDVGYTVKHWLQKVEGSEYEQDLELAPDQAKTGAVGTQTQAEAYTTLTGFEAKAFEQKTISADGKTVVNIYYDRKTYKVTYEYTGSIIPADATPLPAPESYRYGATVTVADEATATGYKFSGWSRTGTFEMPAEAVNITGSWSAGEGIEYTVKHWLQNTDNDEYSQDQSIAADQEMSGKTGEDTEAVAYTLTGFTAKPFEQAKIAADGSTVVNIYYDRNTYKVTYKYTGDNIPADAPAVPAEATYKYGATVPAAAVPKLEGYTFVGWTGEVTTMPAKDVEVTGYWTENPPPEPPAAPALNVEKTSSVDQGAKVKLGDEITYTVKVTNTGNVTIADITVTDTLVDITEPAFTLAAGESKAITYTYTVTQADVDKGKVVNHATATGGDGTKDDDTIEIPTEDPKPELTVTKTASPSSGATEGTTIKYTIVVKNTGNVTVSDISISDSLVNVDVKPFTLAPGDEKTIKYSYKVTAADVEAGSVSNTATAKGSDPSGDDTPPGTDTVVVTTEEDDDDDDDDTPTPTPPAPAGPAGPAPAGPAGPAPGGPGVVPAAPADGTPIADEPVPEAEPEVEIPDEATPLAEGTWALLNLIAAILTTLGAVVALFRKKEEEDEDDEEDQDKPKTDEEEEDEDDNRGKKMLAAKIAGAVAGVVSPIVFFLTEDMSLPMALIDKWTLLMAVFLVAQIAAAVFNKKASELDDEEEEEAEPAN